MELFRTLDKEEEKEFRTWARNNVDDLREREVTDKLGAYHPVVRDEWEKMKKESNTASEDKVFMIEVYEVHTQLYKVKAKDWKEALALHEDGMSSEMETGHDFLETDHIKGYNSIRSIADETGDKINWDFITKEME